MVTTIIDNNLVKSRDASQVLRNCLFFCAHSSVVKGELKRQARELLNNRELSLLVVSGSSLQEDFKQSKGGAKL